MLDSSIVSLEKLKYYLDYHTDTGVFNWKTTNRIAGTENVNGYIRIRLLGISYPAHKLAWYYIHGKFIMVDHKDRIRSHNWIDNLRPTTYQQNAANRSFTGNNSWYKGVYARGNRFEAGIKVNQRRIYLGIFKTAEEAHEAYMKAAREHFGEFALGQD